MNVQHDLRKLVDASPEGIRLAPAYVPGKPVQDLARELGLSSVDNILKLASNENPLGPSPLALRAMERALKNSHIYPDASAYELRKKLAATLSLEGRNVDMDEIITTNGSEALIDLVCRSFLNPGDHVVLSECSFPIFNMAAILASADVSHAAIKSDLSQDPDAIIKAIRPDTRLVIVAAPDNPTGSLLSRHDLRRIYDALPPLCIMKVDEAYHELCTAPEYCSSLAGKDPLNNGENPVITSRTLSKGYGLAGIRVAYAVMPHEFAKHLSKARLPFAVNSVALEGALAALDDHDFLVQSRNLVTQGKAQLIHGSKELGLSIVPGNANFILATAPGRIGKVFARELELQGVIVRPLGHAKLANYVRVSIGLPDQNERFLQAAREVLANPQHDSHFVP